MRTVEELSMRGVLHVVDDAQRCQYIRLNSYCYLLTMIVHFDIEVEIIIVDVSSEVHS